MPGRATSHLCIQTAHYSCPQPMQPHNAPLNAQPLRARVDIPTHLSISTSSENRHGPLPCASTPAVPQHPKSAQRGAAQLGCMVQVACRFIQLRAPPGVFAAGKHRVSQMCATLEGGLGATGGLTTPKGSAAVRVLRLIVANCNEPCCRTRPGCCTCPCDSRGLAQRAVVYTHF